MMGDDSWLAVTEQGHLKKAIHNSPVGHSQSGPSPKGLGVHKGKENMYKMIN